MDRNQEGSPPRIAVGAAPSVGDTIIALETLTENDRVIVVRLDSNVIGVRRVRTTDDQSWPVFQIVAAAEGGFTLRQKSEREAGGRDG